MRQTCSGPRHLATDLRASIVNTVQHRLGASDRWLLAGAAFLVQLALGAVYAWSVFVKPLRDQMGWSRTEATLPFIVTIGVLFLGTFVGGRLQDRVGPRPVALAGGTMYAAGVMLASLVETPDQLWLLVLTCGVIAGIGLGAGYIVPIAMLVKWFPDRRGLITGVAVGGFGAGALITAPVAGWLIDRSDVAWGRQLRGLGAPEAVREQAWNAYEAFGQRLRRHAGAAGPSARQG